MRPSSVWVMLRRNPGVARELFGFGRDKTGAYLMGEIILRTSGFGQSA
jgi:hypothetical protein